MPELPEVETVVNALRPYIEGRRIDSVTCMVDRLRRPLDLVGNRKLIGQEILSVWRRAKYILAELSGNHVLLLHLGMTGSFRIEPQGQECRPHDRVRLDLDDGMSWRFHDPRRFGQIEVLPISGPGALPDALPTLAPEPLSDAFDVDWLRAACRGRLRPIKNLIMDNALVVGVGNIYASESLFRAGIHPQQPAGELSLPRLRRLHAAIREVLREAISFGGTTIINFAGVDGSEGSFWRELHVYGRDGLPCLCCKRGKIRRLVMAGRSSFFCPVCQRGRRSFTSSGP
jgi:formamidopyrimidine-DNA glycosylase